MNRTIKVIGNAPVFVTMYILLMLPTYYLSYLGSNSFILHSVDAGMGAKALNPIFFLHLGLMLILFVLCWIRGTYVGRKWLIIFPILAIVFDFVPGLSAIPFIPTFLHLGAIIAGIAAAKAVEMQSTGI